MMIHLLIVSEQSVLQLQTKEFFIPCQVGLPEERFEELTEDDHGWFEMDKSGFSVTNDLPTVQITAEDLYSNFINAKDAWHDDMFQEGLKWIRNIL